MKLIFKETRNRNQCAAEVMVNDLKMQCTFSTAKVVIIPEGLLYSGGTLKHNKTAPAATISICQNHEIRLKNAVVELFQTEPL